MELFRTISPNGGTFQRSRTPGRHPSTGAPPSPSSACPTRAPLHDSPAYRDELRYRLWKDPQQFDPERYKSVPTSAEIDEAKCKQIGLPRCPSTSRRCRLATAAKWRHQQRLRHGVRGRRRKAAAGLRLCRLCALRLRLSTLPRRAIDDRRVRGFSAQGKAHKIVFRSLNLPNPGQVPVGPTRSSTTILDFSGRPEVGGPTPAATFCCPAAPSIEA